jgi:hypothetical protein
MAWIPLRRRRCTAEPRVAAGTPGVSNAPISLYLNGVPQRGRAATNRKRFTTEAQSRTLSGILPIPTLVPREVVKSRAAYQILKISSTTGPSRRCSREEARRAGETPLRCAGG